MRPKGEILSKKPSIAFASLRLCENTPKRIPLITNHYPLTTPP